MVNVLIQLILNALIIIIGSNILPGIHVDKFLTALLIALVIALINISIKPIMIILTLPLTIFSFGLFIFIINGLLILLVAKIIPGFQVDTIWWAILFSIVIAILNSILKNLFPFKNNIRNSSV